MSSRMKRIMVGAHALARSGGLQAANRAIPRKSSHAAAASRMNFDDSVSASSGMARWAGVARGAPARRATPGAPFSANEPLVLEGASQRQDPACLGAAPSESQNESWIRDGFEHEGRTLAYRLFRPVQAPGAGRGAALVVMLHGCAQDADDFAAGTRMNELAREHGFMVLYPEQAPRGNAHKCWNWFKSQHQHRGRGEPACIAALCRFIIAAEQSDASRVYLAGLSAGGAMAAILARAYPDLFAAIGVHSGLAAGAASDFPSALAAMRSGAAGSADSARMIPPTIVFHGDADTTVHPKNGRAVVQAGLAAQGRKYCSEVTQGASLDGQRYTRTCHASVDDQCTRIEHWELHGAGHAWSGGSPQGSFTQAQGVNASGEMIRFFLSHRLGPVDGLPHD